MFNGDISRFSPADLLAFLSHVGKEGVLTVTRDSETLSLGLAGGCVVNANSETADQKALATLLDTGAVDLAGLERLRAARADTGLPLWQILDDADSPLDESVRPVLETVIHEVLFELFLWDSGRFQFLDAVADDRAEGIAGHLDVETLVLDSARRADEFKETIRALGSTDQFVVRAVEPPDAACAEREPEPAARWIIEHADGSHSIDSLAKAAPATLYDTVKALQSCVSTGWVNLIPRGRPEAPDADGAAASRFASAFSSYKGALRKIVSATSARARVAEFVGFCKQQFDYTLVVASRNRRVARCMRFTRTDAGKLVASDLRSLEATLDVDAAFSYVAETGHPFSGRVQDSALLAALGGAPAARNCAIVPLGGFDGLEFMAYVATTDNGPPPGPLHYLELLAWQIVPPEPTDVTDTALLEMVESVKELPAMPVAVSRILDVLTDPDATMSDLTAALSQDQTLVARLIRVSNSALFGRGQKTTSLRQAVVKLGTRAIQSLVLAASTRRLFPMDQTGIGIAGQSLWQHAIECGLAARAVAESLGYADPDEAFVAGVLHDVGKVIVLLNMPDEFRAARRLITAGGISSVAAERKTFGFDHTRVGGLLLERWRMPESLKASVRHHHDPASAGPHETLAAIVCCGDYLGHRHGSQPDDTIVADGLDVERFLAPLGLSADRLVSLHDRVGDTLSHSDLLD